MQNTPTVAGKICLLLRLTVTSYLFTKCGLFPFCARTLTEMFIIAGGSLQFQGYFIAVLRLMRMCTMKITFTVCLLHARVRQFSHIYHNKISSIAYLAHKRNRGILLQKSDVLFTLRSQFIARKREKRRKKHRQYQFVAP